MYNKYNEKTYYKDENVKVTDLRITCHHITVPIEKINHVSIDFKIGTMTAAFAVFILSLILILLVSCFYNFQFVWSGLIVLPLIFIWLRMVYKTYIQLRVSTSAGKVKLIEASMNSREYLFKIEEALVLALSEKAEKGNEA